MITVQNLTKFYGNQPAIEDVTFSVDRGEVLGFLGPNGAGKTTTMRILTGYLASTRGTAQVAGFDVASQPLEVKRRVGYLPEHPPLYSEMTVQDYLDFVMRIKDVPKERRSSRRSTVLEQCGLGEVRGRVIGHLSKGYCQRVGIAQAIIHDPEVLVLDEPTVGLDPKQIIEIRGLIKSLAGQKTVILSTHILPEVGQTCDRVVIINRGRIVAIDTCERLSVGLRQVDQLELLVSRASDAFAGQLKRIPGVVSVKSIPQPSQNATRFVLEWDRQKSGNRDVRESAAQVVVEGGFGLLELVPVRMSLEDIFLQLTTEEVREGRILDE
ncbi:MAG: ATP-binding cassette domain-containing protein [Deltaproteobacteria bacterium]|nr:ATP-binding cassette domain-containing protein [Deltaproteobacteria bacterium]